MRRSLLITLLTLALLLLLLALHQVSTLLALLIEDASADAIPRAEIPSSTNSSRPSPLPHLVPKLIHQTYIDASIPTKWLLAQKSCTDLHPDYEYVLWTDAQSLQFIQDEYPWFLETFVGYRHPIQRADAIRYFVLAHFGGVYIDLDDGCQRRLDPLLAYPAWVRRTVPTGISNDVMGAVPGHPFFMRVCEQLQKYDRSWGLPYITIMGSTGPLFLSVLWKRWMMGGNTQGEKGRVRVLMPEEYQGKGWSFFTWYKGDSWHGGDARFIFWLGSHWVLVTAAGFALAGGVGLGVWWVYGRVVAGRKGRNLKGGVSPVLGGDGTTGRAREKDKRRPVWLRWMDCGGRCMVGKGPYEPVEQHDA